MELCQIAAEVQSKVVISEKKSVEGFKGEVSNAHACLLVIKIIHSHVLLFYFNCSVVEWIGAVLTGGDGNHHLRGDDLPVDAPCALGRDSKNFAHCLVNG